MKRITQNLCMALLLLMVGLTKAVAGTTWVKGEALLTEVSQITSTPPQSSQFDVDNLLRPESDGVGTNQYIFHTAWSGANVIPAGTDPFLQVHFKKAEQHIIFSMIGSNWQSTYDTPTEVEILAANLPDGEWKMIQKLENMDADFTAMRPERYTSPHIDLGAAYTDVKFLVKKTLVNRNADGTSKTGLLLSLGRFQVYEAVEGEEPTPDPVDPKENINLVFIGNSITYGATLSSPSTQAPPIICRQLIQKATGVKTHVHNGGHSGITTLGFLPGRTDFTQCATAANSFVKGNGGLLYFSIMLGTNDSAISGTEGAPVSTDTYRENMKQIIEELLKRFPTCKILVNYPIWYSPNTHNGARYLEEGMNRLHSYYPIIDELAASYDRVFAGNREVWDFFEDNKALFTAESGNSGTFFLHPNVNGAKRLAEIWARSLAELIQSDGIELKNDLPADGTFRPQPNKTYTITTARGDYGTKDGFLTNTVNSSLGASKGEFAFVVRDGKMYLYSVADKKFVHRDPTPYRDDWCNCVLSTEEFDPIHVGYTGVNSKYPYFMTSQGYVFNVAASTQKGVCLNTWVNHDGGNQVAVAEASDFDPAEAQKILDEYFSNEVLVTYRIVDVDDRLLEEQTVGGRAGQTITMVPDALKRMAYTLYTVRQPVTLQKGEGNIVTVEAAFQLPFSTSPNLQDAHWYNLALREGADIVTAANDYACNLVATKDELLQPEYQWAFQGNPYEGIVVYNRSDVNKTLSKVDDRAILADGIYRWQIYEHAKGFLLGENENTLINEYGGAGGKLGFWHNLSDVGSIFTISEVGEQTAQNVRLSTGASLKVIPAASEKVNGRAVIICPGGGYSYIAGGTEGADWAPLFNELGYTVGVLTYRLPAGQSDVPLTDGRAALKYFRDHAEDYGLKTDQIGVMGFSAGGHLASTIATHTEGDERPAFQILYYPVISMDATITHAGSREQLLGKNPSRELVNLYSNEKQVTAETPTAYLCWASNDGTVPPSNSTRYASALRKAGVPVRTKTFPSGGHGFGFNTTYAYHDQMVADLQDWLQWLDERLTGVSAPAASKECKEYYTLTGQRCNSNYHGIVISQGHKGLVR